MTPTSTRPHAHPIARAAGIDMAIVAFTAAAALLSFATGQGVADWHNIVFPPIVMAVAAIAMLLIVSEVRLFVRTAADSTHRGSALLEVVVALSAAVVVGPMLLIMPFVFLGGIF